MKNLYKNNFSINQNNIDIAITFIGSLINIYGEQLYNKFINDGKYSIAKIEKTIQRKGSYYSNGIIYLDEAELLNMVETGIVKNDIDFFLLIAHEMGHHIIDKSPFGFYDRYQEEEFADKFAGYLLRRLEEDGYLDIGDNKSVLNCFFNAQNLAEISYYGNLSARAFRIMDGFSGGLEKELLKITGITNYGLNNILNL